MPRTLTALITLVAASAAFADLTVGFGEADITPTLGPDTPVWLAGYGQNRRATAVHDPLLVRAVVLSDGRTKVALLCADLVGVMLPTVKAVREKLTGFDYVLVSATHNHEGPDTIGLWGPSPFATGVDEAYMAKLVEACVKAAQQADKAATPAVASYGTAKDESLLGDSRLPKVRDGVLRVLVFHHRDEPAKRLGVFVQWNCHPEAMGSRNTQVTADFCWATVAALRKKYDCPIAYFTGPVGGLMAPPDGVVRDEDGNELHEGDFAYTQRYGEMVAALAARAIDDAKPVTLTPIERATRRVMLPLTNPLYIAAWKTGMIRRDAFVWTGDWRKAGRQVRPDEPLDPSVTFAVDTEVGYLRLGEVHAAAIPGEIYPELIYGRFENPADPNADYPDAPLEKHAAALLPGDKQLFLGLANDEIGYIIPKRQWDAAAPFCYGRDRGQYGEINSVGPDVAPILMKAIEAVVHEKP